MFTIQLHIPCRRLPIAIFTEMKHRDMEYDFDEEYEYECLCCGEIVSATSYPGSCSKCGEGMRNRRMPYE